MARAQPLPHRRERLALLLAPLLTPLLMTACAAPAARPDAGAEPQRWSGRLALRLDSPDAQPFSAGFELLGNARAGELRLSTPLGTTVALLTWSEGRALLRAGSDVRAFDSLDALVVHVTGTAIPVAALFDWLQGRDTAVPGWQVDLSGLVDGRLTAQRQAPLPAAQLRLLLER